MTARFNCCLQKHYICVWITWIFYVRYIRFWLSLIPGQRVDLKWIEKCTKAWNQLHPWARVVTLLRVAEFVSEYMFVFHTTSSCLVTWRSINVLFHSKTAGRYLDLGGTWIWAVPGSGRYLDYTTFSHSQDSCWAWVTYWWISSRLRHLWSWDKKYLSIKTLSHVNTILLNCA